MIISGAHPGSLITWNFEISNYNRVKIRFFCTGTGIESVGVALLRIAIVAVADPYKPFIGRIGLQYSFRYYQTWVLGKLTLKNKHFSGIIRDEKFIP